MAESVPYVVAFCVDSPTFSPCSLRRNIETLNVSIEIEFMTGSELHSRTRQLRTYLADAPASVPYGDGVVFPPTPTMETANKLGFYRFPSEDSSAVDLPRRL